MEQKVIKIGTSAGMTFPKYALKELGLSIGDRVKVHVDPNKQEILVTPATAIDRELVAWTNKFIKKYEPALKALKDK